MKISASSYSLLTVPALLLPIGALTLVYYWKNITHWTQHPIARKLSAFTSPTARGEGGVSLLTWVHVLREVNMDCLSLEKLVIAINPVSKVSCKIDIQPTVPCGRVLKNCVRIRCQMWPWIVFVANYWENKQRSNHLLSPINVQRCLKYKPKSRNISIWF